MIDRLLLSGIPGNRGIRPPRRPSPSKLTQTNSFEVTSKMKNYPWTPIPFLALTHCRISSAFPASELTCCRAKEIQWCMNLTDMGLTEYMGLTEKNATTDNFT